jgi:DNA-binding transcriptional LysR family regulator
VRVGIYTSIASGFLAELLRACRQRHSKVRTDLIDGNAAEHVTAIRQLRLDFAFLSGSQAGSTVSVSFCGWSSVFVASPVHHALAAARGEPPWQDLAEETFIVCEVAPG